MKVRRGRRLRIELCNEGNHLLIQRNVGAHARWTRAIPITWLLWLLFGALLTYMAWGLADTYYGHWKWPGGDA